MITKLKDNEEYVAWILDSVRELEDSECLVVMPEPSKAIKDELKKHGVIETIDFITGHLAFKIPNLTKETKSCQ